ncbi:MAG: uroporphyrinogen-III C-methyltransferase [Gammaproteobacteria bacterium]
MDPSYNTQARVIVTRPVAQSDRLSAMINDAGGTAIRIPALEIKSTDNPEAAQEVFARISEFQWVLFISPNAVRHSLQFIDPDALEPHTCLAIGASTAQAMTQVGIECDAHPKNNFTSEALLELPELQQVDDQNILIIRGNGGRALLGDELTRRGANITYAEVYQRQVPQESAPALNALLAEQVGDIVIANSGETLSNILGMVEPQNQEALLELHVITGSARVAQSAVSAGFVHAPIIADTPDDQALMKAITRWTPDENVSNASEEAPQAAPDAFNEDNTYTENDLENNNSSDSSSDPLVEETTGLSAHDASDANKETDMNEDAKDNQLNDDHDDPQAQPSEEESASGNSGEFVEETAAKAPPPPPAKRGGAGIAWLALLVSLLAAAGTAWTWLQPEKESIVQVTEEFDASSLNIPTSEDIRRQVEDISRSQIQEQGRTQSSQVNRQIEQFSSTINSVQSEQSTLASQIRTQKRSVDNLTDELVQMSDSISSMRGVSANVRKTWVRAETEYFLQTANTRLQLAGDVKSALQALKAADERIVSLGDPSLTSVRAQLSEDILALESLPKMDLEGIALSLNSLASRITTLPLRNKAKSNFSRGEDGTQSDSNSEDGAWTKIKTALGETVGEFVRVSPTEDDGEALLAPEQAYFLYRNLELQLQVSRLAALQGQQATYDDSLASSQAWMEKYFNTDDTGAATVLSRIVELQDEIVTYDLPDISGSLNLIRSVAPASRSSGPAAISSSSDNSEPQS